MLIPLVSVSLLTYNGRRFIENCLSSVLAQTYPKIELLIIDNASSDETVQIIQEVIAQANSKFPVRLIKNEKNLGFAGGHNLGISQSRGEAILCLNQDVVLRPDYIENAVDFLNKNRPERLAAVQGKLRRLSQDLEPTDILDTTGLVILKNRRIINRGQGEKDQGQYEKTEEVFGVDGAAPIYSRQALEDISIRVESSKFKVQSSKREYFDEDFFAYKEDVDLAWRLRLNGWKTLYLPEVIAFHARGSGESAATNYLAIIKERRKIGQFAKYLAFKNQRLMQIKNEQPWLLIKHLPWFWPKEIASWLYVILFERYTLKAIKDLIKQAPTAWKKRRLIMSRKRVSAKEMGRWFR